MAPKRSLDSVDDHRSIPQDSVGRLVAHWRRVRPDLDFSPVAIVSRLARVGGHIDTELARLFAGHGLSGPAFAALVTLARLDADEGVPQQRLGNELGLTSGTVSVRVDRLIEDGLVERRSDPADRRNSLITLSDRGRELFERVAPAHLDNERRLLASLSQSEQEVLATLLARLLIEFEGSVPPSHARWRLGLVLAPVHVAIAMRRAVGLPDAHGLLVRAVQDGSTAAASRLRPGDVLLRARGRDLLSVPALYGAIRDSTDDRLQIRVMRGVDTIDVTIHLPKAGHRGLVGAVTRGRSAGEDHIV